MPKNKHSAKMSHDTRDRDIYLLIKQYPTGITRQELTQVSEYAINQTSSATANLLKEGIIQIVGHRVNPDTGIKCELVAACNATKLPAKPGRRGELKRLREENKALIKKVEELEAYQSKMIKTFRAYVAKFGESFGPRKAS